MRADASAWYDRLLERQLRSSRKFERLLIRNAVNGLFLTDLPAFIQIKLSVKVIKKT